MQGLQIYTKSGEALTTEEIEFAHRVANTHKEMSFGVITMTDETSGVIAEYHADKKICFTSGDVGAYFGYGTPVEMRCPRRGVSLIETAAGSVALNIGFTIDGNRTYSITKNGVEILAGTGTTSLSGNMTNGVFSYNNWPTGGAIIDGEWNGGLYNGSYTITGGVVTSSSVVITSWPSRSLLQSEANSEANQRSAVFITDGTELVSVPRFDTLIQESPPLYLHSNSFAGFNPDFGLEEWWLGGSKVAYYNETDVDVGFNPAQLSVKTDAQFQGYMNINIPDDVAFNQPNPRYSTAYPSTYCWTSIDFGLQYCRVMVHPGTTNINTEQNSKTMRLEMQLQFGNHFYHPHQVLGEYVIPINVDPYVTIEYKNAWADVANIMNNNDYVRHGNYVVESAIELLERNIRYSKQCSDSKIAMLRNGILPVEFEWGMFATHPLSSLLRRNIPMEIEHNSVDLISSDVQTLADGAEIATRVYKGTVTLKYFNTITNTEIRETFTGQAMVVKTTHVSQPALNLTSIQVNYENFPFLYDSTGRALNIYGNLNNPEYLDVFYYDTYKFTTGSIRHDSNLSPLFLMCNGSFTKTDNVKDDGLDVALVLGQGDPSFRRELLLNYNPPYPEPSRNLQYTHPQFIYDYIAASKPIEKELDAGGDKVPVTPSTDWLSSRLADKEIVTIVPLSFVSTGGVEVGMFPIKENGAPVYDGNYDFNYQIGEKAKIYGFARFQFDYATNTFAFKDWTEFTTEGKVKHDGNATYDDATSPTSVTVGETTYTLQPKYFAYDEEYGSTNCVCIAGKTPWTDTKAAYKTQKANIADVPPEGYTPTAEELLYQEVRKAIK